MATEDTLVSSVRRALLRTLTGCVAGLALGAALLVAVLGAELWTGVPLGGEGLRTAWAVDRADAVAQGDAVQDSRERRISRLAERHDCSPDGFGPDVIPTSALVQVRGQVRAVSFDEGWAIHLGERRGRLLAVCRG